MEGKGLIDKPSHYCVGEVMPVELCEVWKLDYYHQLASAMEYIFRCNYKGSKVTDLEKACWWIQRYLDHRSIHHPYEPLNFVKIPKKYHPTVASKSHQLENELTSVVCLIILSGKVKEALTLLKSYVEALKLKDSMISL